MSTPAAGASQIAEWLAPDGPLAQRLPAFEPRPQQTEMAEAVAQAFANGRRLAVEAGTGVGKTFAYLLPAFDAILANPSRRIVVSTHTIALQEQLCEKDLPNLLGALDIKIPFELVKGRQNYIGLRRLKLASERQRSLFPQASQLAVLHRIEDWAYQTQDGSRSDMVEAPPPEIWEKVRSEHGNCLGRRCPHYEPCFYQRARRRAENARILVVNHALLVADLILRRSGVSVLPDYDAVIIDEAHTFEQVATDQLGSRVSAFIAQRLLATLFNERSGKGLLATLGGDEDKNCVVRASRACSEFFDELAHFQRTRGRSNGRVLLKGCVGNPLSPALREVGARLETLRKSLPRAEEQMELTAAATRAAELADQVDAFVAQSFDEHVYWIEGERERPDRVSMCAAPLDAGPTLREWLFERVPTAIMTSATLSVAGERGFDYVLGQLGAPTAETVKLGSPYDFERQVTLHIEAGMPDPSDNAAFLESAARAVNWSLRETEGRAFVLFTSYEMLREVSQRVRDDLAGEGYTILAQGEQLTRSQMLDVLRQTPRAAIFGTDSFWQGVDVVGEALSNVTIVKLPFAVPDRPLLDARMERIRQRGGNPFMEYSLPEAILKLRQGFGRLIRSQTDTGIVVILDPRVVRKNYGKAFLESLPPCKKVISKRPW